MNNWFLYCCQTKLFIVSAILKSVLIGATGVINVPAINSTLSIIIRKTACKLICISSDHVQLNIV